AYPIFDAQGNLQNVIIQHTDVSDRKRAEESLRTSELRFRSLIEKGSEVIALHDREGKVLYMSPSIHTLLGYDPEERIGRSGLENVHPDDLSRIVETLQKLISQPGSVVSAQWRHLHADGSWHWMDGVATNLLDDPPVNAVVHNFRDITQQKLAEEKIILEKELSASIINSLPGIFYLYDESLHLLRWNNNFSTVSGYTSSELQQMSPLDFFEGQEKRLIQANIEKVFAQGKAEWEANLLTKDKQKIPFHFTGWATEFEGKRCMIGMGIDISLRKQNEAQLKLLESVVTYASDGIIITEAENINGDGPEIMYVNEAFCKMTGYSPEELIGKTPRILQGPDTDRKELDKIRKALENWTPFTTEILNYQKSGKPFWVQISLTPVANQDGWYTHWIAVENDISMRKEAEQELKMKNSELQKLSNYLKNVREDERKFLAREVHDELGQLASAIKIDIDWLSPKFPKSDTNIEKRVTHANHTIQFLISTIRKIAASLRPSVLDDFGLKAALEMHCQEFAKLNDIETHFSSNINSANLTTEQKTELFRMTQESLTNVMRHAMATKV
ncbi:MAG: PAS domain S-box protein, partial [Bacteroidota bacterium]|nr:PAS domain S-box protein [Bacteroidota bacterium]